MNKIWISVWSCILLLVCGCKEIPETMECVKSDTTWVVTVGMENSRFAGVCPGAAYDASRMTALFRQYATHVIALANETATKAAVKAAMIQAAENSELFIFFYSGHGGQQRFWDTGTDEADGKDEYLCLYDTYMRDNEVWEIFQRSKGRIMMINDCCHSCSMWRNPKPITLQGAMPLSVTHLESGNVNLLVWSGCPDDTFSYGSATGGKMTNTLLKYFDERKTYDCLWEQMESDVALKRYEIVQRTIMGSGFTAKPIFR